MKVFGADFVLEGIFRLVSFRRCTFLRCKQPMPHLSQWQDKRLSMDQSAMAGPGWHCVGIVSGVKKMLNMDTPYRSLAEHHHPLD